MPTASEGARLRVEELTVRFATEAEPFVAVDGISFEVPAHTTVALVGESGSGKSVTAQAIMRLLSSPPATATGRVNLGDVDLFALPERRMRRIRGERIAMIFQDPGTALNPVYSIGFQVAEALRIRGKSRREAKARALELLARVGFPEPRARYGDYPHELSGGMRQRAMIAIALAADPELLIADEPTTALDMLAAAQINALLADLQRERAMSMLLISHDIAAVAENAEEVIVLYAGQIVERGSTEQVLRRPCHPYTQGLLESIPPLRTTRRRREKTSARLPAMIADSARPSLRGCRFEPRCPVALERCREETPRLLEVDGGMARCLLVEDGAAPLELRRAPVASVGEGQPEREGAAGDDDDLAAADAELEEALSADAAEPAAASAAPTPTMTTRAKTSADEDEEAP